MLSKTFFQTSEMNRKQRIEEVIAFEIQCMKEEGSQENQEYFSFIELPDEFYDILDCVLNFLEKVLNEIL